MVSAKLNAALLCLVTSTGIAATTPTAPDTICVNDKCQPALASAGIRARSAAEFVDSVGVNVHFTQAQTAYVSKFALVKQKLLALGVHHARDGAVDQQGGFPIRDQAALLRELGNAGIRFTFIFNANVHKDFVQGYPAYVAPAFEAYEFPNELNAAASSPWVTTLRAWAPIFQSYIRDSAATAQYPIIGPSLTVGDDPAGALGDLSAYLDFGNMHAYYSSRHPATAGWGGPGHAPCTAFHYGSTAYDLCNAGRVSGDKPVISTETGWGSDASAREQVTPAIQAKYVARALLLHFSAGVPRTFIYQLVDAGSDGFNAFGLLTESGEEKPAFTELRSLLALAQDTSSPSTLGSIDYALNGDTSDVDQLLLQKSDGTFLLILWLEKPGFDPIAAVPVNVPPRALTVRLKTSAKISAMSAFQDDGLTAARPVVRLQSGEYPVTVGDNLIVLQIKR